NHWETNYRAYQVGFIRFRYALQPHNGYDPVASTELARGLSEPLIVASSSGGEQNSFLRLSSNRLTVLSLRPSRDGKAWMVTLYNPGANAETTNLIWGIPVGAAHYSNTNEETLDKVSGAIAVAGQDVVTVRIEH
ncbi:MAG TPA: hypothetical protein VIU45_06665, partial [Chitinophagaceae bacterium]